MLVYPDDLMKMLYVSAYSYYRPYSETEVFDVDIEPQSIIMKSFWTLALNLVSVQLLAMRCVHFHNFKNYNHDYESAPFNCLLTTHCVTLPFPMSQLAK